MTPVEIKVALQAAFGQCEAAGYGLSDEQKQILLQAVAGLVRQESDGAIAPPDPANPLDELTPSQRQALLQFVQEQNQRNASWKVQLLNDWLEGRESGAMQFIRDLYGLQWLDQVQPIHIAQYAEAAALTLKVGDRIEVSNNLWEWVQDDGPCSLEWFPCTVVSVSAPEQPLPELQSESHQASCIIRFDNGMEYEIQGIYDWNQYNWRWFGG